jgi:hypothetical protein
MDYKKKYKKYKRHYLLLKNGKQCGSSFLPKFSRLLPRSTQLNNDKLAPMLQKSDEIIAKRERCRNSIKIPHDPDTTCTRNVRKLPLLTLPAKKRKMKEIAEQSYILCRKEEELNKCNKTYQDEYNAWRKRYNKN